jgi:4-hydroxyphenylpyruvate dioxygenase-like putative hemolysin
LQTRLFHGHHVISDRLGKHITISTDFIRSEDNCIMLCDECHLQEAHSGNFAHGPVLDAVAFKYSHDNNKIAHNLWVLKHDKIWQARLLPRK